MIITKHENISKITASKMRKNIENLVVLPCFLDITKTGIVKIIFGNQAIMAKANVIKSPPCKKLLIIIKAPATIESDDMANESLVSLCEKFLISWLTLLVLLQV